jgi:NitT/TauT family transport system permease protein
VAAGACLWCVGAFRWHRLVHFEARNDLDTATVFSGLLTVILIGLAVRSVIFRTIETRTVNLWGMQR